MSTGTNLLRMLRVKGGQTAALPVLFVHAVTGQAVEMNPFKRLEIFFTGVQIDVAAINKDTVTGR